MLSVQRNISIVLKVFMKNKQKKINQACNGGNFSCQQCMDSGKRDGDSQHSISLWAGEVRPLNEKIWT